VDVRRRFLEGLASVVDLDPALLDRAGTTVVGTSSRAASGAIVFYETGRHTLVWCDPDLVEQASVLASDTASVAVGAVQSVAAELGAVHISSGDMRVLVEEPRRPGPIPTGYMQRWLDADQPSHVDLVRAFADRNSAEDVEEAALGDLDNFDERAINVLVRADQASGSHDADIVAYASAADWEWDERFCDIGVLVDPAVRATGLGTLVVGHTVAQLIDDGRLPLYRYDQRNAGSRRIANALGFEVVTTLSYFGPQP